jgi:endonuclease G
MIGLFFQGSGFDRGHLIPSANHRHSQESMNNTFFLSNIAPQVRFSSFSLKFEKFSMKI